MPSTNTGVILITIRVVVNLIFMVKATPGQKGECGFILVSGESGS